MKLSAVAGHFDKAEAFDAYTGEFAFLCQTAPWDGKQRDSVISQRRVLSVKPGVQPPARRVVEVGDEKYIIGLSQNDTFNGSVIRTGFVIHGVDDQASVFSLEAATLGTPATEMYASMDLQKFGHFVNENSTPTAEFHIHFSASETITTNSIITLRGAHYVMRSSNLGQAGTLIVQADALPNPVFDTATTTVGDYDPVSETVTGTTRSFPVVRVRWQSLFAYLTTNAPQFGPDDIQIAVHVNKAAMVPGMRVTLADGVWLIQSIVHEGNVQLCRATKHA